MRIVLVFDKDREDTTGCYIERVLKQSKNFTTDHWQTRDANKIPRDYDLYFRIDHGDYEHDLPVHYDLVFCAFKQAVEQMTKKGVRTFWAPFACDPQMHKRRDVEKKYDLGFVGTSGKGYRPWILNKLREKYPNSFIGKAPSVDLDKIYSASKIGFNYAIRHR